jgi:hypothetical protein
MPRCCAQLRRVATVTWLLYHSRHTQELAIERGPRAGGKQIE